MQTGNTSLQGKVNRHAPMVSVGLPAFKRAYLAEALECWRRQTYGDFELLVSDDASPEDLREVAAPFLDDPRFAYVRRERNSSPYFARNWNDCLAWARGKYFVLASDDDLYDARFLEEMVALAEAHPECDIFMCGWSMLGRGADGAWQRMPMPARRNWESGVTFLFHRYAYNMRNVAPPVLVRTQALRDLGGFADLPAAWFVDDLTWAKLANRGGVFHAQDYLLAFRMAGQNITMNLAADWVQAKLEATEAYIREILPLVRALPVKTAPDAWRKAWLSAHLEGWLWNHCAELAWDLPLRPAIAYYRRLHREGRVSRKFALFSLARVCSRRTKRLLKGLLSRR